MQRKIRILKPVPFLRIFWRSHSKTLIKMACHLGLWKSIFFSLSDI